MKLIFIGCEYKINKVLTFVLTNEAGATRYDEPYEARFSDKFGNVYIKYVARSNRLYNYFKMCNVVDLNNQAGQYDFVLEKSGLHKIHVFDCIQQ